MIRRCTVSTDPSYYLYGAKGIVPCEDWFVFEKFLADMGHAPEGTTLDRIDNSKGYGKENCRWATKKEQANNRCNNLYVTYKGERMTCKQLAERTGVSYDALHKRIALSGWSAEQAVNTPVVGPVLLEYAGELMDYKHIARLVGLKTHTLYNRLFVLGWPFERAINTHVRQFREHNNLQRT
jgi:hypothetical protein